MSTKYKHIFFDLDHTLWDFDKNSGETLTTLFYHYALDEKLKCTLQSFIAGYSEINFQLWHLYDLKKVTKEEIRDLRFHQLFALFNYYNTELASQIDIDYMSVCPDKTHLIEDSLSTLVYLSPKYQLHIITNGFLETQTRKLKASQIETFFSTIITSECSGFTKPDREMFRYALNKTNANYKESLMIGDNLNTDIKGAKNIGMDQVYFNQNKKSHKHKPTFEINSLNELRNIL